MGMWRWMDLEMHKIPEIRPIILILPSLWVKSSSCRKYVKFWTECESSFAGYVGYAYSFVGYVGYVYSFVGYVGYSYSFVGYAKRPMLKVLMVVMMVMTSFWEVFAKVENDQILVIIL